MDERRESHRSRTWWDGKMAKRCRGPAAWCGSRTTAPASRSDPSHSPAPRYWAWDPGRPTPLHVPLEPASQAGNLCLDPEGDREPPPQGGRILSAWEVKA